MLSIRDKRQFRKDYKKLKSSGKSLPKLAAGKPLPERCRDHTLIGDYAGCPECHVSPDWLLIYKTAETELILMRTGSHSDYYREITVADCGR